MKPVRTMPTTHTARSRVTAKHGKTVRHSRPNPAELGYSTTQCEQLTAIKAEMSRYKY